MLWLQRAEPIEDRLVKLTPDAADIVLRSDSNANPPLTEMQKKLRDFVKQRSISVGDFTTAVREQKPDLADFFDTVGTMMALHFQPSPVGIMLARHAIAARSAQAAEQMDKMFGDTA